MDRVKGVVQATGAVIRNKYCTPDDIASDDSKDDGWKVGSGDRDEIV